MKRLALVLLLVACKKEPVASTPVDAGSPEAELVASVDSGSDPCTGAVVDLSRALSDPKCHAPFDVRPPLGAYDKLAIHLTPSPAKLAPGGALDFDAALVNTGDAPVSLLFGGESPGIGFFVVDGSNRPTSTPTGTCSAPQVIAEHFPQWVKIVLPPRGEARARFRWHATRLRYGAPRKGEFRGGCEELPDGALPKGTYSGRLSLHLWTQHAEHAAHPDWAQDWPGAMREVPIAVE